MQTLKLDLDALRVQSFATAELEDERGAPEMATANTCYRSCLATVCFC